MKNQPQKKQSFADKLAQLIEKNDSGVLDALDNWLKATTNLEAQRNIVLTLQTSSSISDTSSTFENLTDILQSPFCRLIAQHFDSAPSVTQHLGLTATINKILTTADIKTIFFCQIIEKYFLSTRIDLLSTTEKLALSLLEKAPSHKKNSASSELNRPYFLEENWLPEFEAKVQLVIDIYAPPLKIRPTEPTSKKNINTLRIEFLEALMLHVSKRVLSTIEEKINLIKIDFSSLPSFLSHKLNLPIEIERKLFTQMNSHIKLARESRSLGDSEKHFTHLNDLITTASDFGKACEKFKQTSEAFSEAIRAINLPVPKKLQDLFDAVFSKLDSKDIDRNFLFLWYETSSILQLDTQQNTLHLALDSRKTYGKIDAYIDKETIKHILIYCLLSNMLDFAYIAYENPDLNFEETEKKAFKNLKTKVLSSPQEIDNSVFKSIQAWEERLQNRKTSIIRDTATFRRLMVEAFPRGQRLKEIITQLEEIIKVCKNEERQQINLLIEKAKYWCDMHRNGFCLTEKRMEAIELSILGHPSIKEAFEHLMEKDSKKSANDVLYKKIRGDLQNLQPETFEKYLDNPKFPPFLLITIINVLNDKTLLQMACHAAGKNALFFMTFEKIVQTDQFPLIAKLVSRFLSQIQIISKQKQNLTYSMASYKDVSALMKQKEDLFKSILYRMGGRLEKRNGSNCLEYYKLAADCYLYSNSFAESNALAIKCSSIYANAITWSPHKQTSDEQNLKMALDHLGAVAVYEKTQRAYAEKKIELLFLKGIEKNLISLKNIQSMATSIFTAPVLFKTISQKLRDKNDLESLGIVATLYLQMNDMKNYYSVCQEIAELYKNIAEDIYPKIKAKNINISLFSSKNNSRVGVNFISCENYKTICKENIDLSIQWYIKAINTEYIGHSKQAIADLLSLLNRAIQVYNLIEMKEGSEISSKIGALFSAKTDPVSCFLAADAYAPYWPKKCIEQMEKGLAQFFITLELAPLHALQLNPNSSVAKQIESIQNLDEPQQKTMLHAAKNFISGLSNLAKLYSFEHVSEKIKSWLADEVLKIYKAGGFKYLLPKPYPLEAQLQWILLENCYTNKQNNTEAQAFYEQYLENPHKQTPIPEEIHAFFVPNPHTILIDFEASDILTHPSSLSDEQTNFTTFLSLKKEALKKSPLGDLIDNTKVLPTKEMQKRVDSAIDDMLKRGPHLQDHQNMNFSAKTRQSLQDLLLRSRIEKANILPAVLSMVQLEYGVLHSSISALGDALLCELFNNTMPPRGECICKVSIDEKSIFHVSAFLPAIDNRGGMAIYFQYSIEGKNISFSPVQYKIYEQKLQAMLEQKLPELKQFLVIHASPTKEELKATYTSAGWRQAQQKHSQTIQSLIDISIMNTVLPPRRQSLPEKPAPSPSP